MCDTLFLIASPEACLEPSQTSAMKTFVKTDNGYFFFLFLFVSQRNCAENVFTLFA